MGLHLTIDGWRRGRNTEGWKRVNWSEEDMLEENLGTLMDVEEDSPEEVEVKPRIVSDILPPYPP